MTERATEVVARALCKAAGGNPNERCAEYKRSSYSHWLWELYADRARDALAEMREAGFVFVPVEQVEQLIRYAEGMREVKEGEGSTPETLALIDADIARHRAMLASLEE